MTTPESGEKKSIVALFKLAAVSPVFRTKMVKRRCTVLAVVKHLEDPREDIREYALDFCRDALHHRECVESLSHGFGDNFEIVRSGLIECARNETLAKFKATAVSLLRKILDIQAFESSEEVMETLKCLAYGGEHDDVTIDSAVGFCDGINKQTNPNMETLWTVVDFTTFPYAKVRATALTTIAKITSSSECVRVLLNDTDLLENFALIVQHGSDIDCDAALNIARQLARNSMYHSELCSQSDFLGAVVELVTKENILNRSSHFYSVETVLALLSNEANTKAFLPFRNMLPWLVTFVNTTTADEDFKQQVVSVIVRLSMAFLDEN
jgi:hypothetical protein